LQHNTCRCKADAAEPDTYEKTRRQKNDKRPTPYPIFVEAKMNGILEKTVSDFCLHGAAKF